MPTTSHVIQEGAAEGDGIGREVQPRGAAESFASLPAEEPVEAAAGDGSGGGASEGRRVCVG